MRARRTAPQRGLRGSLHHGVCSPFVFLCNVFQGESGCTNPSIPTLQQVVVRERAQGEENGASEASMDRGLLGQEHRPCLHAGLD